MRRQAGWIQQPVRQTHKRPPPPAHRQVQRFYPQTFASMERWRRASRPSSRAFD
ncbi:hypothetical protein AZA_81552 [Nitrospirillum viridazoti Y2]|nr:hypothetical protein AZA_81552 [Nitrospirillum amazonense Y2]